MPDQNFTMYTHGEWSALYVDGKLVEIGDSYWVEEKAFQLLGVEVIQSADYLRGGDTRDGAAQTLDELHAYTAEREAAEAVAATLRAQADELHRQADALDGGKR